MLRRFWTFARLSAPAMALFGCAVLQGPPGPVAMADRFSALPTRGLPVSAPVTVR